MPSFKGNDPVSAPNAQPRSYRLSGSKFQGVSRRALLLAAGAILCPISFADAKAQPLRIIAFGDSLTAGLGVAASEAFPVKLEAALRARGHTVEIVNAGVSGDTTSAGLSRLDWSVPEDTHGVILELGANDALRGIDPAVTRKALDGILNRLKERGIPVLFCGMRAPRNLGPEYAAKFDAIFPELAAARGVLFYPFFLEGVAANAELNQQDGIHPNARGVEAIVSAILPKAEELLDLARKRRA